MKRNAAIQFLKSAQLQHGHALNTRKTYRHWLLRYITGAQQKSFSGLQGFLDHLTTVDQVNPARHKA